MDKKLTRAEIVMMVNEMIGKIATLFETEIPKDIMETSDGVDVMLSTALYLYCNLCSVSGITPDVAKKIIDNYYGKVDEINTNDLKSPNPYFNNIDKSKLN